MALLLLHCAVSSSTGSASTHASTGGAAGVGGGGSSGAIHGGAGGAGGGGAMAATGNGGNGLASGGTAGAAGPGGSVGTGGAPDCSTASASGQCAATGMPCSVAADCGPLATQCLDEKNQINLGLHGCVDGTCIYDTVVASCGQGKCVPGMGCEGLGAGGSGSGAAGASGAGGVAGASGAGGAPLCTTPPPVPDGAVSSCCVGADCQGTCTTDQCACEGIPSGCWSPGVCCQGGCTSVDHCAVIPPNTIAAPSDPQCTPTPKTAFYATACCAGVPCQGSCVLNTAGAPECRCAGLVGGCQNGTLCCKAGAEVCLSPKAICKEGA